MGLTHSLRILSAMAQVAVPTAIGGITGHLRRADVDDRTRWFGDRVVRLLDIKLQVSGGAKIDPQRAYVYMANHQSHLDIPVLYASVPTRTLRMVGKAELFKIPIWGRSMRAAGYVSIDRSNRDKAIASIERCKQLIADGVSVFLAPEGTRSRDGRIGPLKKGGFHLAIDTGTPIVPVAISGTFNILPRGGRSSRLGQRVHVHYGVPIDSNQPMEALMDTVAAFFTSHVEEIPIT
jgi:1-acyl-sn-glycerol-3-phosphate acyltransferase